MAGDEEDLVYCVVVFGPYADSIRLLYRQRVPWHHEATGGRIRFLRADNPRSSGDRTPQSLARMGTDYASVVAEWDADVRDNGDEGLTRSRHEKVVLDHLGLTLDSTPCLVVFPNQDLVKDARPTVIRIPRAAAASPECAARILESMTDKLAEKRLGDVIDGAGVVSPDRLKEWIRDTCRELESCFNTAVLVPPGPVEVEFVNDRLARVRRDRFHAEVRGSTQVALFRAAVDGLGKDITWKVVTQAQLRRVAAEHPEKGAGVPLSAATYKRAGNRLKSSLGELAAYWHQDGSGVRWAPPS